MNLLRVLQVLLVSAVPQTSATSAAPTTRPIERPAQIRPDTFGPMPPVAAKMYQAFCRTYARADAHIPIEGWVVDQFGKPVDRVKMTLERGALNLASDAPSPSSSFEDSVISGHFKAVGDLSKGPLTEKRIAIRFHRDGYYGGSVGFSPDMGNYVAPDPRFAHGYIEFLPDKGLRVLLQKIEHPTAPLTPLFPDSEAQLELNADGTVTYVDPAHPADHHRAQMKDAPAGVFRLTEPHLPKARIDWAWQPFVYPPGGRLPIAENVSLTAGDPDVALQLAKVKDVEKPFRSMGLAPVDGYQAAIPIDDGGFTDEIGWTTKWNYFYIKMHGKYGRGYVRLGLNWDSHTSVSGAMAIWMNPTGSRDLEDGTERP